MMTHRVQVIGVYLWEALFVCIIMRPFVGVICRPYDGRVMAVACYV